METVCVSDDPVCHESAVGAACDTEMFRIDHRVPPQNFIREIHQVLIVHSSVDSVDISKIRAQVAELVDAHVSGACVERHAGSSPVLGTTHEVFVSGGMAELVDAPL